MNALLNTCVNMFTSADVLPRMFFVKINLCIFYLQWNYANIYYIDLANLFPFVIIILQSLAINDCPATVKIQFCRRRWTNLILIRIRIGLFFFLWRTQWTTRINKFSFCYQHWYHSKEWEQIKYMYLLELRKIQGAGFILSNS